MQKACRLVTDCYVALLNPVQTSAYANSDMHMHRNDTQMHL